MIPLLPAPQAGWRATADLSASRRPIYQFIFIGYGLFSYFVNIHNPDIHSELAALKCELPTQLGRGYAWRQETRKAACGGEKGKKNFQGTPLNFQG